MAAKIHRFDFGALRDFRGPIVLKTLAQNAVADEPAAPPPPVFNEQELEAARLSARKQGYADGFAAGLQEAKNQSDQKLELENEVIQQLAHMLQETQARYTELLKQESTHLAQLVMTIARKIAGEAITARGEQEAYAIVEQCLPVIFSKPRLLIDINPALFERALERIEGTLRQNGYEGEVQFRANEAMGLSDITLDWGTGEVRRSTKDLWNEVETLMQRIPLEMTFQETLNANPNTTGA